MPLPNAATDLEAFLKAIAFWLPVVILTGLTARFFLFEVSRSHRLLRLFHKGEHQSGPFRIFPVLAGTYFGWSIGASPQSWISPSLFRNVRKRVEHEVFHPRPEGDAEALETWRSGLKSAMSRQSPTVTVETPQDVANAEEGILRYFEIVNKPLRPVDLLGWWPLGFYLLGAALYLAAFQNVVPYDRLPDPALQGVVEGVVRNLALIYTSFLVLLTGMALIWSAVWAITALGAKKKSSVNGDMAFAVRNGGEFLTKLEVRDGFIAPIHLVAGLLNRVGEEWREIIKVYKHDLDKENKTAAGSPWRGAMKALRTMQKFTFDCWLLWGPSIPICNEHCPQHTGSISSIQLGYGDENSSVEIIGPTTLIGTKVKELGAAPGRKHALAVNVAVEGWISHSRFFDRRHKVSKAIRESWKTDGNGRVLLLMERDGEEGVIETKPEPGFYYTAYLWACFVILCEDKGEWRPAEHSDTGASKKPWFDLLPFFEHGNIADGPTYLFLKKQLALKAMAGLARLVEEWTNMPENAGKKYPLKFAYACAIDDSGCGNDIRFASGAGASATIKDRMVELLAHFPTLADIVEFELYKPNANPHQSCLMPESIAAFYEHVDQVKNGAASSAVTSQAAE